MAEDSNRGRSKGATITPDMRWMTYREMADFLAMKEESARRRAQREGWPRQLGNDGRTRVGVPGDAAPINEGQSGATDTGDDRPGEVATIRETLARERDRADRAEARADRAETAAALVPELRERAGRAEGEAATLRDQLKAERTRAVTQMREVEAARDAAKAEMVEWTAGGPLARAVRAFLNRRGRGGSTF